MEQKIMSFRLTRSGRRAIALNNQRCRSRRARAPVAKRMLVPVAALSFWSCFKPQASENFKVDAPESSSTAKNTKSLKKRFFRFYSQLTNCVRRFFSKGRKRPVPKNDEDNRDAAADEKQSYIPQNAKTSPLNAHSTGDAVTIVDLLDSLPIDRRSEKQVTKKHLLDTLSDLKSTKGLRRTQVQAISLAMDKLKNMWEYETVPDSIIDSIADDLKISPRLLYAPRKVTKHYMIDTLCKLQSGGELTTDQMQDIPSVIQFLKKYCADAPSDIFIKSIASILKMDPECFRPPPGILKFYLLDALRKIESEKGLANIQRQDIQGAITWLEEKYRSNMVHDDVFEVIASRVKVLRGIFQFSRQRIHETATAG